MLYLIGKIMFICGVTILGLIALVAIGLVIFEAIKEGNWCALLLFLIIALTIGGSILMYYGG